MAHKMERFRCQEHTTAITEPSPIPLCAALIPNCEVTCAMMLMLFLCD